MFFFFWGGVEPSGQWPTVPAPDDDECGAVGEMLGRGN
jgi:hypothetical protein